MTRRFVFIPLIIAGVFGITAAVVSGVQFLGDWYASVPRLGPPRLEGRSFVVTDRTGRPLASLLPRRGGYCYPLGVDEIPNVAKQALMAAEDKRFYDHRGIDLRAVARAWLHNIQARRVVMGGSTLTQQLMRMHRGRSRTMGHKMEEMAAAYRLEQTVPKKTILQVYLNRAFFGNHCYGLAAAARFYFRERVDRLSLSQTAFLIGLVKSGTRYNPISHPRRAERRRRYVLRRMRAEGMITEEAYRLARLERVRLTPPDDRFFMPHFVFAVKRRIKNPAVRRVRSTLDSRLSGQVQDLLRNHVKRLRGRHVTNAAVVILEVGQSELKVRSYIGSVDYHRERNQGAVDGAASLRQPGSTMKPFMYGMIFEQGVTAASVIPDVKTEIPTLSGTFAPQNYDRRYHGPVTVREALACSYNIPAVRWLHRYESGSFLPLLRRAGLNTLKRDQTHYGLGLVLGTAEVTLTDLTAAFSVFAKGGVRLPLRMVRTVKTSRAPPRAIPPRDRPKRIFREQTAYLISHILSDRSARMRAFPSRRGLTYPFRLAYKTGTSKDYRDAWVVGTDGRYVTGIWLGDFRGRPMRRVTGGNGAVPLLYDIFLLLNPKQKPSRFARPPGIVTARVCPLSGKRAGPHCPHSYTEVFAEGTVPTEICRIHRLYRHREDPRRRRVFAVLPDEYRRWSERTRWPRPGNDWVEVGDASPAVRKRPAILSPQAGDIYRIDPHLKRESQTIRLTCRAGRDAAAVRWRVNGVTVGKAVPDEGLSWRLTRGEQTVQAEVICRDGHRRELGPVRFLVQ